RAQCDRTAAVAGRETLDRHNGNAVGRADLSNRLMQQLPGRRLPVWNGLSRLAGDADVKRDGHRPSNILVTGRCDEVTSRRALPVSPSRNPPSAGSNSMRWQVSRLAEQDFLL